MDLLDNGQDNDCGLCRSHCRTQASVCTTVAENIRGRLYARRVLGVYREQANATPELVRKTPAACVRCAQTS